MNAQVERPANLLSPSHSDAETSRLIYQLHGMAEEDSAEATMYQAIGEQVEAMAASGAPSGAEPAETGEVPVAAAAASAAGAGEDGDDADSDDEGSNAKADAAARAAGIEVVPGTLCMSCQGTGTTKLLPTRIPFFREVIICAFLCDDCGFRSSEVMTSETQDKGCSFSLKVEGPEDLQRQMLKGDKATLRIPALDVEVPITTMRGVFTTLEGVLDTMASDLERQQPVRRAMDPAAADSIDAFIAKARLFQAGDPSVLPFVFELDDPSGNSFVENPKAPARDPRLTVQFYRRTREQNFFCGLNADSEAVLNGEGGASGEETAGAHTALLVGSSAVTTSTRDAVGGDTHKHIKAGATIAPGATDRSKATPGGIMAASLLEKEVQRFDTQCSNCGGTAQTRMCMTSIPHFKEALIMALVCPHCGYKDVEVKGGGAVPPMGTVHELRMSTETAVEDLRRDVLKSDTAGVEIPELELEMEPGSLGGMYTTVEGLLDTMRDRIVKANPLQHAVGDSASMAEAPRRFREFLDKMQRASRGELAVTVILKDPMANSWVYSPWDDSEGGEDGDALAATVGLRGAHLSKEAKATDAAEVAAAAAAAAGGTSGGATATTVAAADAKGASAAAVELPLSTSAAATGRDPRLTLRWYTRTEEEDIDLGIADMDVSAFPAADVDIGTVDAVAAMVDEDASAAAAAESAASSDEPA